MVTIDRYGNIEKLLCIRQSVSLSVYRKDPVGDARFFKAA